MAHRLDDVDRGIRHRRQVEARNTTAGEIAEKVGGSAGTVRNRIDILEADGSTHEDRGEATERVAVALSHSHLPKLAAADLVTCDEQVASSRSTAGSDRAITLVESFVAD
jgi:hypothetical protein